MMYGNSPPSLHSAGRKGSEGSSFMYDQEMNRDALSGRSRSVLSERQSFYSDSSNRFSDLHNDRPTDGSARGDHHERFLSSASRSSAHFNQERPRSEMDSNLETRLGSSRYNREDQYGSSTLSKSDLNSRLNSSQYDMNHNPSLRSDSAYINRNDVLKSSHSGLYDNRERSGSPYSEKHVDRLGSGYSDHNDRRESSVYADLNNRLHSGRSGTHSNVGSAKHDRDSSRYDRTSHSRLDSLKNRDSDRHSSYSLMDSDEDLRPKHNSHSKAKKKKKKNPITVNLSGTRYDVVRQVAEQCGFIISKDEDQSCYLFWNDSFVSTERITDLKPYQRINHFPGMGEICRKDCLARNMMKMTKVLPDEYSFVPRTWIFPSEFSAFQNYVRELKKKKKSKTFIVKPANGAMGNGIFLCRNPDKIPQNEHMIVQEYLDKPFLIDGYKCDMRIYVLVTSCDPLRIFLFNDGLLRMGTEKYIPPTDGNLDQLFVHLTNYSVNKHNENYDKSGTIDTGSKRSLKYFNDYLRRHDYDVAYLWKNVTDMIVKTMLVAHPHVLHAYRMCRPAQAPGSESVSFEILGFDIMLDRKLRPWLLEINRSPSFGTDEKLDYDIKSGVVEDTFRLLNIKSSDKRKNMAAQKAQAQKRLLRPTKRADGDVSELEKKRQSTEKKKEELKDMLTRIRKDASREDFENRNCGHFKRIFPADDKFRREKYAVLLGEAFKAVLNGRATALEQEIQRTYNNMLKEEDILDMLAQCEADEKDVRGMSGSRSLRGPKPLLSMPVSSQNEDREDDDEDDEYSGVEGSPPGSPTAGSKNGHVSRKNSGVSTGQRSRSGSRPRSNKQGGSQTLDDLVLNTVGNQQEKEDELTQRTLVALNDMRIKFPGKTDDEADYILDKLHENWKFHKPRIASYWLVKLDSIKRRKVIDIVRSNVRAVMQRIWKTSDIDSLRLYRVFSRVFNRLLWSHGQGLWNCFQSSGSPLASAVAGGVPPPATASANGDLTLDAKQNLNHNSWETIFSKSSDSISPTEMACCRRIVQLCRDCLLIVYQFAAEAKNMATNQPAVHEADSPRMSRVGPVEQPQGQGQRGVWNPTIAYSQRMSRLYNNRSQSLNNLTGPS